MIAPQDGTTQVGQVFAREPGWRTLCVVEGESCLPSYDMARWTAETNGPMVGRHSRLEEWGWSREFRVSGVAPERDFRGKRYRNWIVKGMVQKVEALG